MTLAFHTSFVRSALVSVSCAFRFGLTSALYTDLSRRAFSTTRYYTTLALGTSFVLLTVFFGAAFWFRPAIALEASFI